MTTWKRIQSNPSTYESPDGQAHLIAIGNWGLTPKDDDAEHDPTFSTIAEAEAWYAANPYPAKP